MSGPSLQRLTVLSCIFHLTFFLAVFFAVKQSSRFVMPSPYVVSLVGPDVRTEGRSSAPSVSQTQSMPSTKEKMTYPVEKSKAEKSRVEKPKAVTKADERDVSEKIAKLRAKEEVMDKMKKRAELRDAVISLKGSGDGRPASSQAAGARRGGGSLAVDYYAKVTSDIRQNWIFPDTASKNLEAIIAIRIMKDGSVQVTRMEKSSGNTLFDRSALRAITKASPVTPPPYEMEIGVKFYP